MNNRKLVALVLAIVLALAIAAAGLSEGLTFTPGVYTQTVNGMHGPLSVEVTVSDTAIENVVVTGNVETPGVSDNAVTLVPQRVVENQSLAVDVITGASITSRAVLSAVEKCLEQAGGDMDLLKAAKAQTPAQDVELNADVIIVGGGGAGLAAAVSATDAGSSVILIEKSGFLGGNSIVCGSIYNSPDPAMQDYAVISGDQDSLVEAAISEEAVSEEHQAIMDAVRAEFEAYKATDKTLFDSPNWFALQTWNGGDKVGDLTVLKTMAENALPTLHWMMDMGTEFQSEIILGGGALYPRTHRAIKPNGVGFIYAFTDNLIGKQGYTQLMETTGKSLIMDGDKVVGVNAVAKDGSKVTLIANKGVVLATGGFAGNVEMRQQYCEGEKWPELGASLPTSNMPAVTGDGIRMAEEVGAELVNMEQIQLLPYCNPTTGATYDICPAANSTIFVNKEGERFVREDGRRDEMSKAIIEQTDGMMYMVFGADTAPDPETTKVLGGDSLAYYLENNLSGYVCSDTLEGLAQQLGMPEDAFVKTIGDYNAHVKSGEVDAFGRVSYDSKSTIEKAPFYAFPRKPAAHHTMGGVRIDSDTHALRADGSIVEGLYCAGEITGVVHGANRLGGNAVADFCVFGRIAGTNAASAK